MPGGKPKALLCEQWEALLVDALDGTLSANESAAFSAHRDTCLECAQLLEESKRGSEWLHFLETEPEVPADLIGKILAKTSGAVDTLPPVMPAGVPLAMPEGLGWTEGWTTGWLPMMERHAAQSRWMMTAAMAFFSIAFMLNQTGLKLNGFRLADLKPTAVASGLTRHFYVANKSVMRYYDNLRFVYELESRVREMRRDALPESPAAGSGTNGGKNPSSDGQKPAAKHAGGSARAPQPEPEAEPVQHAEPTMASFASEQDTMPFVQWQRFRHHGVGTTLKQQESSGGTNDGRRNIHDKRSERSLA